MNLLRKSIDFSNKLNVTHLWIGHNQTYQNQWVNVHLIHKLVTIKMTIEQLWEMYHLHIYKYNLYIK